MTVNISVHVDGKVASHHTDKSAVNQITVNWYNGPPDVKNCPHGCTSLAESCWCPTRTEIQAVFDRLPAPSELSELKVGAFKPQSSCSVCGEVNAFFEGESFDTKTIFEHQNKFYRNIRSVVLVGDKSFRNPPVVGPDSAFSARSAIFEIESLLEHLVYHPNTAPFISYRLIQRFVTSSPSAEYVQAVATAFRTGRYGRTYSGQYGDLGATIAAILLHPEAREMNEGAFREPLIKLVHFLRAMEFEDWEKRTLLFEEVIEKIGQEPFASPTVFNFYMPDYELPSGQVAPEFQIFNSATVVDFLNGMFSLIDHQGVTECKHGLGVRTGFPTNCKLQDSFKLPLSASTALSELNLLLTGGRVTNHTKEAVMQHSKNQNDDVKAVQEASVLAPEFHTLGAPRPVGIRATESGAGRSQASPRSYKAVVNLYLDGGADSFNLLVPINCALHDEYLAVRGPAALSNNQLLEISSTQACRSFGLHHKFPKLRAMYQAGEAAFVSNIGSLVAPLTKYEYKTGATPTCVGLFSHSDQTAGAQTLKCQVAGASPRGVGGRLADALAAGGQKFATNSFSLKGKKTWSEGFSTLQQAVDSSGDFPTLENFAIRRPLIENITKEKHGNVYSEEYAKTLGKMVDNVEYLAGQIQNVTLSTTWPEPEDWGRKRLLKQFKAISKLVASRTTRKAEREFFYVQVGGFDTHNDMHATLDKLFAVVDEGLDVFVKEMKAQGVFESVVLVTTSDFGRTMTSNGKGTDHGWAGNTFVLGGNIRGGEIYNEFPSSLVEGNLYDVGRGRMIPKYPWESVMLPIAEWMGMDAQDKSTVFPNLQNFNSSRLLPTSTLFNM
ncbi:unnamed protein product [Durusdinium trenchii]